MGLPPRALLLSALLLVVCVDSVAAKKLRFASPLQALTIWDPESKSTTSAAPTALIMRNDANNTITKNSTQARHAFLPKYKVALQTENAVRIKMAQGGDLGMDDDAVEQLAKASSMKNWFQKAASLDMKKRLMQEAAIDKIVDDAVEEHCQQSSVESVAAARTHKNPNHYQFVGVIQKRDPEEGAAAAVDGEVTAPSAESIKWYARKKPKKSNWSLRVVHVDKEAIVTDLFRRGKVDIFSTYQNTGAKKVIKKKFDDDGNEIKSKLIPSVANKVEGHYHIVERSWRTLWNVRPKHFFTDSSGHYWRERRLKQGLYSDGKQVFESSYDFKNGKNGMHKVSTVEQFAKSKKVDVSVKKGLLKRFKEDSPDIVYDLK